MKRNLERVCAPTERMYRSLRPRIRRPASTLRSWSYARAGAADSVTGV